jgi:hypothetical protein
VKRSPTEIRSGKLLVGGTPTNQAWPYADGVGADQTDTSSERRTGGQFHGARLRRADRGTIRIPSTAMMPRRRVRDGGLSFAPNTIVATPDSSFTSGFVTASPAE